MVYLYDDKSMTRVELKEITGIDKDSNVLIILLDTYVEQEVIAKIEESLSKKTGKKCVVLPKGFSKVLGIK